jgi:hypothetical protein
MDDGKFAIPVDSVASSSSLLGNLKLTSRTCAENCDCNDCPGAGDASPSCCISGKSSDSGTSATFDDIDSALAEAHFAGLGVPKASDEKATLAGALGVSTGHEPSTCSTNG